MSKKGSSDSRERKRINRQGFLTAGWQTLDVLFERSVLSVRQLEAAMGVPCRAAQRYIERLEEIGILGVMTGRSRNCLYRVDEIIQALEG